MLESLSPDDRVLRAVGELAFARDADAVAEVVRRVARELTGADGVTFVVRDGDECHYLAENAVAPLWAGRRFPMRACVSGWVIEHAEAAIIADIYRDDRIAHDRYRPTFVKSLAMVPIGREEPVGAVGLYWQSPHDASDGELRAVQVLADAAALGLANARRDEALRQSVARERAAREAAEAATRSRDEWLSIVSHELRTPLSVIQGRAHMLLREAQAPEGVAKSADAIARNADHLVRIVDDLLDASKIATGTMGVQPERVDVVALIRDVLDQARPAAAARGMRLTFDATDRLVARADPHRLRQVLWNLVANAIKFSHDGAHVTVVAFADAAETVIEVRDTGIGLDGSSLLTIFDKFTQVDSSSTRAHGGLGLGLAIAKRLVELHGGTIAAASPGLERGSVFRVRLPA